MSSIEIFIWLPSWSAAHDQGWNDVFSSNEMDMFLNQYMYIPLKCIYIYILSWFSSVTSIQVYYDYT